MLFYRIFSEILGKSFLALVWLFTFKSKEGTVDWKAGKNPEVVNDWNLYKAKQANTAHAKSYQDAAEMIMNTVYAPFIPMIFLVVIPTPIISSIFSFSQDTKDIIVKVTLATLVFIFLNGTMWLLGAAIGSSQAKRKKKQALKLGEDFDYKPTWFRLPRDISPIISILLILPFVL